MNTELSTAITIAWRHKDIRRNQEMTIMTFSRLLETKCFSDSSLLLPCIFDICWTLTKPFSCEPGIKHIHDPTREFWWSMKPSVFMSKLYLWPPTIGKIMVLRRSNFLQFLGFDICPKESCLLVKAQFLLFINVDDILVLSKQSRPMKDVDMYLSLNSW